MSESAQAAIRRLCAEASRCHEDAAQALLELAGVDGIEASERRDLTSSAQELEDLASILLVDLLPRLLEPFALTQAGGPEWDGLGEVI